VHGLAEGFAELVAQRDTAQRDVTAARSARDQARAVAGLVPLRAQLVEGQACPLCGSLEDAAHGAVLAREAERKQAERDRARAERDHATAAAHLREVEVHWRRVVAGEGELAAAERGPVRTWLDDRRKALDGEDAALQALGEAAAQRTRSLELAMKAAKTRTELDRLRAACDTHVAALDAAFAGIPHWQDRAARDGAALSAQLRAAAALDERLQADAAAEAQAGRDHATAASAAQRAREELDAAEQGLEEAARAAGGGLVDVVDAAATGAAAIAAEGEALAALQRAVERARTVLQERAEQRRAHELRDRPELDEADAVAALEQARARREEVARRQTEVRAQLFADDAVRRMRGELAPRLAAATRELETWAALDGLIGSSGGDAFVVFAQGLTLDLLLTEANRRLAEIARRYRLERNHGGEMDFVVVDLDLGGARRSLQTLSGGETFLVSLSLALALATLAAPRSRVETLFLDEGFGTLDAQHLEQALGALDTLQAAGCQVGVISHVEGIAERIGACVDVEPQGGGQSRVRARAR
jgi:exonuclease SbcC